MSIDQKPFSGRLFGPPASDPLARSPSDPPLPPPPPRRVTAWSDEAARERIRAVVLELAEAAGPEVEPPAELLVLERAVDRALAARDALAFDQALARWRESGCHQLRRLSGRWPGPYWRDPHGRVHASAARPPLLPVMVRGWFLDEAGEIENPAEQKPSGEIHPAGADGYRGLSLDEWFETLPAFTPATKLKITERKKIVRTFRAEKTSAGLVGDEVPF